MSEGIIVIILIWVAAIANAVMDTLQHHYSTSIFKYTNARFWNPRYSHLNKYKGHLKVNGPKFFGSTTFLVWTTDGWHLFQFIFLSCWQAAIAVSLVDGWWVLVYFAVIKFLFGVIFEIMYGRLLRS